LIQTITLCFQVWAILYLDTVPGIDNCPPQVRSKALKLNPQVLLSFYPSRCHTRLTHQTKSQPQLRLYMDLFIQLERLAPPGKIIESARTNRRPDFALHEPAM
jgi:hypothetical protein